MKKGTKIGLGIGCGVLLLGAIVVLVGGYFALNYLEKAAGEGVAKYEVAGRDFGKTTDQQGCINEGIRRSRSVGLTDFSEAMGLTAFADACLATSRPTANFCDGVPSFWSMKESEWGSAECKKSGVDPEKSGCIHVMKRKHQFCSKPF